MRRGIRGSREGGARGSNPASWPARPRPGLRRGRPAAAALRPQPCTRAASRPCCVPGATTALPAKPEQLLLLHTQPRPRPKSGAADAGCPRRHHTGPSKGGISQHAASEGPCDSAPHPGLRRQGTRECRGSGQPTGPAGSRRAGRDGPAPPTGPASAAPPPPPHRVRSLIFSFHFLGSSDPKRE